MNERDRLIELMMYVHCKAECCSARDVDRCGALDDLDRCQIEAVADHLLANGVIVPPVKVGDIVYFIYEEYDEEGCNICILECKVEELGVDNMSGWFRLKLPIGIKLSGYFRNNKLGHNIFLTREEAEQALKERSDYADSTDYI